MKVGDIVVSNNKGNPLRCGSGIYSEAAVLQAQPELILVSKDSTMKWTHFSPTSDLYVSGKVGFLTFLLCLKRIESFMKKFKLIYQYTQKGFSNTQNGQKEKI